MKSAWETNPTIQGSVEPSDLSVVYFHVMVKNGRKFIKESTEKFAMLLPNSVSCFLERKLADYVLEDTPIN